MCTDYTPSEKGQVSTTFGFEMPIHFYSFCYSLKFMNMFTGDHCHKLVNFNQLSQTGERYKMSHIVNYSSKTKC